MQVKVCLSIPYHLNAEHQARKQHVPPLKVLLQFSWGWNRTTSISLRSERTKHFAIESVDATESNHHTMEQMLETIVPQILNITLCPHLQAISCFKCCSLQQSRTRNWHPSRLYPKTSPDFCVHQWPLFTTEKSNLSLCRWRLCAG